MRGLQKSDTETMTMGGWIDYIIEYNNMMYRANHDVPHDRRATQKDFDLF